MARETPEGRTDEKRRRTHPECNSGIRKLNQTFRTGKRGKIVKRDRRLDRKKTYIGAIRKSLFMEITKLIFESSIGLREPGDGETSCCGSVGPRRSGRGDTLAEPRGAAAMDIEGGCCSERVAGKRLRKEEKDGQLV
jgi:hypothetical protein